MIDFILVLALGFCIGYLFRGYMAYANKRKLSTKKKILVCKHQWERIGKEEEKRLHCINCHTEI